MAAFNAELAAKALERRVQGLETQLEAVTKLGRAAGDSVAAVLELKKQATDQKQRIETLEKLVKALMETRGDSKQAALGKIEQTLRDLEIKQQKDRDEVFARMNQEDNKREKLGLGDVVRKQDVTKLIDEQMTLTYKSLGGVAEAESRRREVEAERKVQAQIAEQQRQFEAKVDQSIKAAQQAQRDASERAMKALLDTQLSVLTARLNAVEGKLSK